MLDGHLMIGGSPSLTMMEKKQLAVFEDRSVAVQVTRVNPTGKRLPEGGEHSTDAPVQLSLAVAAG
jgi:hypothetical protein